MFSKSSKRGFTLIELLVVIAIIAILAAILFPVFSKARDKARQASCLSNLKQLGLAIVMYTEDYDGTYPMAWEGSYQGITVYPYCHYSTWVQEIYPYVNNADIFWCPGDSWGKLLPGADGTSVLSTDFADCAPMFTGGLQQKPIDYIYNTNFFGLPDSGCTDPADTFIMWDTTFCFWGGSWTSAAADPSVTVPIWDGYARMMRMEPGNSPIIGGHSGGLNFAFADGHAKWVSTSGNAQAGIDLSTNNPAWGDSQYSSTWAASQ